MENFKRTFVPYFFINRRNAKYPVFVTVEYKDKDLSITGVEAPLKSGNCLGNAGQIVDTMIATVKADESVINTAEGWDLSKITKLFDIWKKWHLNDLHAGCEHQRELGWEEEGYDKHPSEPCPVCGYKFGTAWNTVEVPEEALKTLKSFTPTSRINPWRH